MRKSHLLGVGIAVAAVLTISVTALADSQKARFDLAGIVGFVGMSQDASNPTSVQSDFKLDRYGNPKSVVVKTRSEMVLGALGIIKDCDGQGCEDMAAALNGAPLTSLHNSTAFLTVSDVSIRPYTLPTPYGDIPLFAEVISGDIEGQLKGRVQVPTSRGLLQGKT